MPAWSYRLRARHWQAAPAATTWLPHHCATISIPSTGDFNAIPPLFFFGLGAHGRQRTYAQDIADHTLW